MNLDEKVGRDSIFLAQPPVSGLFGRLGKKLKRVAVKIGRKTIPKSVYKKLNRFEKRNRSKIKKIGAAAAVATAAYFAAPYMVSGSKAVMAKVSSVGGSKLAKMAGNRALKKAVRQQIRRKITRSQQRKIARSLRNKRPEDALKNPVINKIAMDAAALTIRRSPQIRRAGVGDAADILAREGAYEVKHQFDKTESRKAPVIVIRGSDGKAQQIKQPDNDIQKKLMLVGAGLLATKLLG